MVTLRRQRMYEFLEKLIRVSLPRIRDFKGIESKFDGRGNYTLGIQEQIIFPEINIDQVDKTGTVTGYVALVVFYLLAAFNYWYAYIRFRRQLT